MTKIDSPTSARPRAQLMYDAVVAAYISDISDRRRRSASVAKRQSAEHRRPLGRVLAREAARAGASPGRARVSAEQLAIAASC